MEKPRDYDSTKAYGEFVALPPGGYVCKIQKVEESLSRSGRKMNLIYLDIAEGEYAGYYADLYDSDTRQDKRWGCIVYQLEEDKDGKCNPGLKTFHLAVEASNAGFDMDKVWGDGYCAAFKNKLVGGVFRREQYENNKGELKWATRCFGFRSVDIIRAGIKTPEDKYLPELKPMPGGANPFEDDGIPLF